MRTSLSTGRAFDWHGLFLSKMSHVGVILR
jgi:hypothetical protein